MNYKEMNHGNHHNDHLLAMQRKLKISIIIMIPLILISPIGGRTFITFKGDNIVQMILGTVMYFWCATPFFSGAKREIKNSSPAMMTLITMGVSASYFYSMYSFISNILFKNSGVNDFWFEMSTLITIMLIGHVIEMKAIMRAGDALQDIASLLPKKAHLLSGEDINISDLRVGDQVLVKENEKIPTDGIIESKAFVDESMITGESRSVSKIKGNKVFGGSLNQNIPFSMTVDKIGKDSYLSQISRMVNDAQNQKSKLENVIDRVAGYLFWAAVIIGLASFGFWKVTSNNSFALMTAVSVLVIACPHALGIAVPLVVNRLVSISSKNGFLIQNRTSLEKINKIKYALMDKTGTLTDGKFVVHDIVLYNKEIDILQTMAALEEKSTHPIALSIVKQAGIIKNTATDVKNVPGVGIEGSVANKHYQISNLKAIKQQTIDFDEIEVSKYINKGLTVSILVSNNKVDGFVVLGDSIKEDSRLFIQGLQSEGITPVMLTGDNKGTAEKVSKSLKIADYHYELKPENKSRIVSEYKKKGGVLFIGDGVNDSPALATSDIGFAIGAGTSVAINTADVVLVNSNPSGVLDMIKISKKTLVKMKQNLWFGAGYNIIALPVAAGILYPSLGLTISPIAASLIMSASTTIVALNALTLSYE